jgi:hypothetical protein
MECELQMLDGRRQKFVGELSPMPLPKAHHTTRYTFYRMFSEEVSRAIELVIERWRPELPRRKQSKEILALYICEAARRVASKHMDTKRIQ